MVVMSMINGKSIVGNHCIISELAMGAFGRVYLAQHAVLTNRVVALKLMHTVPLSSEQKCNQFLQEARFLELLRHHYILPILDVGIHQGMPYIVSEYASGGSLRNRMKDKTLKPLREEEIQKILSQVGEALQYAHQKNIIHRDLKPENILFNAKNDALLADFGLATMLATASIKYISNAGTPRYMSPEQFRGIVSKESDQYALGCITYELCTGHPLFGGHDPFSLMYQHVNDEPVSPSKLNPNVHPNVEQAILKALAKQRHDRHADIRAFITALCSPIIIQNVQEPTTGRTITDSDMVPELTSNVTELVKQSKAVEDEEQSTFLKNAFSSGEESTFIKTASFGEESTFLKTAFSSGEESTFVKGVANNGVRTHSHNTGQDTPLPATPGHISSKELPTLLPLTPLPELPTSRQHKRGRMWLILALVSFSIIVSLIGGSLIMYSSFHTSVSDKGKVIPTSAQLEVQPNSLDFGTLQVGVKVIQTVLITNTGGQTLNWEVDTGGTTWLQVGTHSGTIKPGGPQQIIYTTANTLNLVPGTYVTSENIHSNTSNTRIPVKLIVISSNGKKQAKLSINPGILNFGNVNAGQQTTSLITVSNTGTLGLNWTADTGNVSWLSVSPGSGTIQSGGFPQTLSVKVNAANLSAGSYSAPLTIQSNGGNSSVTVILGVSATTSTQQPVTQPPGPTLFPPQINVNPQHLSFDNVLVNTTSTKQLSLTNSGGQSLTWTASTNVNWISLDNNGGTINAGNSQSINLTVNTSGFSGGQTYSGTVSFSSNGGSFNLPISLSAVANPAVLSADQTSVNANNDCTWVRGSGHGIWTCNLTLRNVQNASSALNWTASSSGFDAANMTTSFSPSGGSISPGASASIILTILTGSSQSSCWASFSATIIFTGPNTVDIPWNCTAPTYVARPSSLNGGTGCQNTSGNLWVCTITLTQQSQGYINFSTQQSGNGAYASFSTCCGETYGPGQSVTITVTITLSGSCPASITIVFLTLQNVNVPWSC